MKYKVGQKVVLRDDLDYEEWSGIVAEEYQKFSSPIIVTVKRTILNTKTKKYLYIFKEIRGSWEDYEIIGLYAEPDPKELQIIIAEQKSAIDTLTEDVKFWKTEANETLCKYVKANEMIEKLEIINDRFEILDL